MKRRESVQPVSPLCSAGWVDFDLPFLLRKHQPTLFKGVRVNFPHALTTKETKRLVKRMNTLTVRLRSHVRSQ